MKLHEITSNKETIDFLRNYCSNGSCKDAANNCKTCKFEFPQQTKCQHQETITKKDFTCNKISMIGNFPF